MSFQKKLESELQQIEVKFEAKKRKFTSSSETFQEELKKHCKRAIEEDTFQKLVEKQYAALKKDLEERMKAQAAAHAAAQAAAQAVAQASAAIKADVGAAAAAASGTQVIYQY